jgi:hypothetical protein
MTRSKWLNALIIGTAAPLVNFCYRALAITYRYQLSSSSLPFVTDEKVIYACFHQNIFHGVYFLNNTKLAVMISSSNDGEIAARFAMSFSWEVVRGSTGKAEALKATLSVIRLLKKNYSLAHLVDGPLGPKHIVKDGVLYIASQSQTPIVPISFSAEREWKFNSWDEMKLAKPFARIFVILGEPMMIPPNLKPSDIEIHRRELEIRLRSMAGLTPTEV